MKRCEWCGADFEPTQDAQQAYCRPTHSKRAKAQRKLDRESLETAGRCPTPYKRNFKDLEDYNRAGWPKWLYPYKCKCGAVHASSV